MPGFCAWGDPAEGAPVETWTIVAAVLVAVLVGAALPVLFEVFRTARELRRVLRNLDARMEPAIREIEGAARHARKIGDALEPHVGAAAEAVGSVAALARPLREIQGHLQSLASLFGAIVPALVAALRVYRATTAESPDGATRGMDEDGASGEANSGDAETVGTASR